jgi:phospholipid/cholesterol/gamma-HCH transport system substrate-binding protein
MKYNFTEAAVGIVTVVLLAAAIFYLLTAVVALGSYDGYTVYADFASVKGVKLDDPVQIAGVTIGRVESIRLHGAEARLTLRIKEGTELHADAVASVADRSLFTAMKFIDIKPGSSKDLLRENQRITNTRPALDATDVIVTLVTGGLGLNL